MPFPGDRRAPVFDLKQPEMILRFFDVIQMHGRAAGLTQAQMITWARFYAPYEEEELWSDVPEARGDDYAAFRAAVLKYYPHAIPTYTVNDLQALTHQASAMLISDIRELGDYYRDFQQIASYLVWTQLISEFERKEMFREGLHPVLNRELEQSL